ncbi:DUF4397 domain-containing protein [Chitinophaga barathri]|uniref:DUF4397 domain-containing protein n=2 Tax=Chitinophaga barathri TaxID=1647451 RepID=A0A3N4MC09_9BACT|nr:DUF4397 domain-containing protein [Chitinophaga barathri]
MRHERGIFRFLVSIYCMLLISSCSKTKLDHMVEHPDPRELGELSAVRIINSVEFQHVMANGDSLTNFILINGGVDSYYPPFGGVWSNGQPGTTYFPVNGFLGREWRVPKALVRENGRLDLFFQSMVGYPNTNVAPAVNYKIGLTIQQKDNRKMDYYLGYHPDHGDYFVTERDETPPSKPENIRLRVINLTTDVEVGASYYPGAQPDLHGPVTLTYADGTPVSPITTQVSTADGVTDYIELPAGTYQFRVISKDGWMIPGTDGLTDHMLIDPITLSISYQTNYTDAPIARYLVHAPIHSFQPGGVYTILAYPSSFAYLQAGIFNSSKFSQNAFRIIQDNTPAANLSYARVQGFNALPGTGVSLRVGGRTVGRMPYGEASGFEQLSVGETEIQLLDDAGKVLVSATHLIRPNQYYTIFAFPDAEGRPQMTVMPGDLSGNNTPMPYRKRFINLCPDIPYATFTTDNGAPLAGEQVTNLQPGIAVTEDPYINGNAGQAPYQILAYRSEPGMAPGVWADDIPVLHSRDFIAREELYARFNGNLPAQEPGYYTVALIGRTGANVPQAYKARMVIIKHNK